MYVTPPNEACENCEKKDDCPFLNGMDCEDVCENYLKADMEDSGDYT